jgi:hypothetical protein
MRKHEYKSIYATPWGKVSTEPVFIDLTTTTTTTTTTTQRFTDFSYATFFRNQTKNLENKGKALLVP